MIQHARSFLATSLLAALALTAPARAGVLSATPTLPLLGIAYLPASSAGCFPLRAVCVAGGSLTLTSLVSSSFNMSGEDFVTDATYTATLTDLSNNPIGPVTLTGTVEQEVVGRTFSAETGSWTTDIVSISLTGALFGNTLTMTQDASNASTGTTSIVAAGDAGYMINSFFDVFVDLTLDSSPPLHTTEGPIHLVAAPTAAPEPADLAFLALPACLLLSATTRRRQPRPAELTARR